jgi:hypothetical protein
MFVSFSVVLQRHRAADHVEKKKTKKKKKKGRLAVCRRRPRCLRGR